ncbi:uncharacterized protein N7496_000880 [Penicillium cataractarum]|uniref:Uncharacterized protein n=1 Tax=Penicillium cataractarum TaxID=2100454 RepID=A0A9X0B6J1_9EURO|nr:uncharacterized protein N7496_000880 [Penicillium cataractarum]KAJ5389812.1 hypothetical protein N7496_000880 [Penicillium cataractarum]
MARSSVPVIAKRSTVLLLLSLMAKIQPSYASAFDHLNLLSRSSGSCPSSYDSCGSSLPDDFCCPSTSTCISLDNASSAICCPSGASCDYISPIVCDVQEQNATAHPKNSVKTTKLDSSLPTCGSACCPFGYTCQGNSTCALNTKTSSTVTSSNSTSTSTSTTADTTGATFTPVASPSSTSEAKSTSTVSSTCPSFPTKAVLAGFFPGAIFGAILAILITICIRRRTQKKTLHNDPKTGHHWSQRSSSGAVMGISGPIASEDNSYRTDFLLRSSAERRSSMGGRSMLSRTGSRVRSLFSGQQRPNKDVPPVPEVQVQYPVTPPRQRQPSTESIKVYSPPGAFSQSRKFLGPEPYPGTISRPDTTFTDLVQAVGFNDSKGNPSYKLTELQGKELKL